MFWAGGFPRSFLIPGTETSIRIGHVMIAATKAKGSQFVMYAKALHGNFFDGRTLRARQEINAQFGG